MKFLATLLLAVCVVVATFAAPAAACTTYTVRPGDSGWRISSKLNVPFTRLQELNDGVNLGRLRVGQVLRCGTGGVAQTATAHAAAIGRTSGERCRRQTQMFCGTAASCNTQGGTLRSGQCSGRRGSDNICCDTSAVNTPSQPQQAAPQASASSGTAIQGPYAACTGRCLTMTCRGQRVSFSRNAMTGTQVSSPPRWRYSAHDLDILTRTLFGEANTESRAGVAAVTWTIINRMLASRWPSTLAGVCKQRKQYSCWNGGRARRNMERLSRSSSRYLHLNAIAKDVLEGRVADFTGGANHYFARYIATPSWACNMTPTIAIGTHQFFRDGRQQSA